jgi:hypothetical protein
MAKLSSAWIAAATMAMGLCTPSLFDEGEFLSSNEPKLRCGDCKHCPKHGKTFCKTAKHHTNRNTIANNCKQFKID